MGRSTIGNPSATVFPGDGEVASLMREKDWAATSLGPVERWPQGLKTAVQIVLTSRFSMWMGWGDELSFLYNDKYRADTLATKHPSALGMAAREVWSEIWTDIGPRLDSVMIDGRATWDEGLLLMLERDGYREETYHTFSYSPLHDDDGSIRGILCVVTEETARLISERRVALLGRLASEIAASNTDDGVLAGLGRSLGVDSRDLPFTLTYLFDDSGTTARLVSATGIRDAHAGVPATIEIDVPSRWPLGDVVRTGSAIEVSLADEPWPAGPWATAPKAAFVAPLPRQGHARPAGVLIAGLNPHRRFDAPYHEFVLLVAGQLAAGLANARAYEHERQRAESLAQLDRAKTEFFSNVSHEFRTPLTLMLGPLQGLLADPDLPASIGEELKTSHRNALRLLKLVNTMLDFSRIEAGRASAEFQTVDLPRLTSDLASMFRAATEQAGVRLVVECPPLETPVFVDPDMWEKIVLNLLSNAFKFTLEGEIAVKLARRSDRVELVVRDTGSGIPAAEIPRIFDRFHRVAGTRGRTHEGTGIGLALVQELVRLHEGTLDVQSELGLGTTFTVSLPLDEGPVTGAFAEPRAPGDHPMRNAFVEEALRWLPDAAPTRAPETPVARERLLVADDNADMRDYLRRLLGSRWELETVANGRDALAAMESRRPHLVITDVMMPELDGFGLVAAIRSDPDLRDIPVIMLSARAGEEARVGGLQAGADDYLIKPFSSRDLVARVETQLVRATVRSAERAHARRLATIFEQTPIAIAILRGPEHVFEIANSRYLEFIGRRDVLRRTVAQALPEVVEQGFIDLLDRVYRTGEPFVGHSVAVELARGEGGAPDTGFFDFVYQPLVDSMPHDRFAVPLDGGAKVTGIAVIAHEVTALATAQRAAESANRTKDEFLAMLGHELRNPLAPIATALQLMRLRGDVGAERERAVIERQVQHLVGLVDDLLDISRITRGNLELRAAPTEIADVVARSIEAVSPLLEDQRHTLSVDVPRGLFVHGDATRLVQVVSNLLVNAAKYTPSGGRIAVGATREVTQVAISVTDDGIGIEPEMLRRIFEPFTQAPQALDRGLGGLGLGLAIVKNLVALHGGTVTAASAGRGHGTQLVVHLPAIDAVAVAAPATSAPRVALPGDVRVLVVDDNLDAAEMLAALLETFGYHVRVAHDGPRALVAAEILRPEVAVLDIGLPVMDGYELARLLRCSPTLSATKLVAVTGYGQAQARERTAAAGFSAHLVKPVDIEQLHDVIEQLVAEFRRGRAG